MGLSGVVDLDQYPIHRPDSQLFQNILQASRKKYKEEGLVTLPGFLCPTAVHSSVSNITNRLGEVWHTDNTHNVFLDGGRPDLPASHVRNRQLPTQVASLPYDLMDEAGAIVNLYNDDNFLEYIRLVLGVEELYRLQDPLGAATINVFHPQTSHSWHFDESTFSVTMMLQTAETGGLFRYTQQIRQRKEEDSALYQELESILEGTRPVNTLQFEPGTLSIFSGSTSLHEVSRVSGGRCRLVAVLCFSNQPGKRNSPEVQQMFWGRVKQ